METVQLKEIRRERVEGELIYLSDTIKQWIEAQRKADVNELNHYIGRHKTQLEALESVLVGSLAVLKDEISPLSLSTDRETGVFYDECRDVEMAILWLQRVWEYFKIKFDQRKDDRLKQLLVAADEIVWSCYRQIFSHERVVQAGFEQGPTPLAFIEPQYSPAARHSDNPLSGNLALRGTGLTDELQEFIKGMPISLLRLPPWCADSPWWLVFVAHEVGHLIQSELKLVEYFRNGLQQVAQDHGLQAEDVEKWGRWSKEIFADVFSVMMLGPWALWAIVEFEWTRITRMRARKERYPAPLVRIAFMASLAGALGLPSKKALRGFDPQALSGDHPHMKTDLPVVEEAVNFALQPLPHELGPLKELCGFKAKVFQRDEEVDYWSQELQSERNLSPAKDLKTARQVISGAVQAWSELVVRPLGREERARATEKLAERTKLALALSAEPGTRGALQPSGAQRDRAGKLAQLLRKAGREELELDDESEGVT